MLGSHPDALATPESKFRFLPYRGRRQPGERIDPARALDAVVEHWSFKIWDLPAQRERWLDGCADHAELLLRIVDGYGERVGRPAPRIWIDHTPGNIKFAELLLDQFEGAQLIHMVRDGRATAASVRDLDWGPNTAAAAARWWVDYVERGLAAETRFGPQRVMRVVYEELVRDPERILGRVADFVGIDFRAEMVEGRGFRVPGFTADQHALVGKRPDPSRLDAWRTQLTPREIEIVESLAGDRLTGLGYPTEYGGRARRPAGVEKLVLTVQELYRRWRNRGRLRRRIERSVAALAQHSESGARS